MPQVILGLDIGSYSVKIAELSRSFKSFELINFYERRIQYNEVLSPEESTAAAIQTLIEDNIAQYDTIICALPGQHVSSRILELPFGNVKKIDEAIEYEIENHVPFSLDELVVDYHVVSSAKDLSKVLVVYAPKGIFVKYLTMLNNINIDPRQICVEGIELVSLMMLGISPPDSSYALVDIGHSKTTITICRGKRLVYTRTVSAAGKHFTEVIQRKLNVPFDEAERFKVETGQVGIDKGEIVDDLSKQVIESLEKAVDDLIISLKQTFFSYQNQEGESVMGIFLSGGSSRLPGLDRYISEKLKQNVTYLDCLQFHFNRIESSEAHPSVIPQALALALRVVATSGLPDINFRRGEFSYKGDVSQLGGGMKFVGVSAGFVALLGILYFGLQYYSLNRKINRVNMDVATMVKQALPNVKPDSVSSVERALQTVKNRKNDMTERMQKLNAAIGFSAVNILKDISQQLPPREELKLDVDNLTVNSNQIRFSGRTTSFEAVDKVKSTFERLQQEFKNVTMGNVSKGVGDEIKFELTMKPAISGQEDKEKATTQTSSKTRK